MAADDLKNVSTSIFKHIEDNLASVASIDFPGVPFSAKGVEEWIQVRLLGPTPVASRRGEREESWIINANCFARVGYDPAGSQRSSIYRHMELAGEVREVLHQADVPLKDWDAGGDPTIGYIRCEEVQVQEIPNVRDTDLMQAAATVVGVVILS